MVREKSSSLKKFYFVISLLLVNINTLFANPMQVTKQLEQKVPEFIDQAGIPGISAAYLESGKIKWVGAFGLTNAKQTSPVTADTVFEAASLSKPVLAFIVLRMVERKQLTLDTSLYSLYKEPRMIPQDFAKLLTPRLILSHQSGLPNWGGEQLEFKRKPGSEFGYSGEGYVYLQKVVEKISGMTYQALAEKEVFKPLNMLNSRFTWTEKDKFKLATGHDRAGKPVSRSIPNTNAAASLHTTATDYARFLIAWMQLKGISQQSVELAFEPITTLPPKNGAPKDTSMTKTLGNDLGWGLGWGIQKSSSQTLAWHWGDNGVFRAFAAIDPLNKKGIVYFTNSQNGLSIAKAMVNLSTGDPSPIIDWLGYGQSDSQIWQSMKRGYIAESNNDFELAIKEFKKVIAAFPDNQNVRSRIEWIRSMDNARKNPVSMKELNPHLIIGNYNQRVIIFRDQNLYYHRGGGKEFLLKPLTKNMFSVGDIYEFRLEVVYDETGLVNKLVGHYINGGKDESIRSD